MTQATEDLPADERDGLTADEALAVVQAFRRQAERLQADLQDLLDDMAVKERAIRAYMARLRDSR